MQKQRPWSIVLILGVCSFIVYLLSPLDSSFIVGRRQRGDSSLSSAIKSSPSSLRASLPWSGEKQPLHATAIPLGKPTTSNANTYLHDSFPTLNSDEHILQPFPHWTSGISADALVEGIRISLQGRLEMNRVHKIYIIDEQAQLYAATVPRPMDAVEAPFRRAEQMEMLAIAVLQFIRNDTESENYPHLKAAIRQGGFAYIANHADSVFCCDTPPFVDATNKPVSNVTIPIFTLSAPVDCQQTFPLPTYETIKHALKPWARLVQQYRIDYPWSEKKPQAVWRGAPTGRRNAAKNTRVQVCALAETRPNLIDAKLTGRRQLDNGFDETRYLGPKMPMVDFQNYRATIDVDGHSWSSRFGELLCYSSVVLKVQPGNVDYFHPQLQPWVHYIPVRADLSDLFEKVEFAVSDDPSIREIIDNANLWCLKQLNIGTLVHDMAGIWDTYALHLDQAGPSWSAKWMDERQRLFDDFNFTLVE